MQRIVLDTNCLLISLPKISPYHKVWTDFVSGKYLLCVSNEIIEEYLEVVALKTTNTIANNVVSTILNAPNAIIITPYYKFHLIDEDYDDNKFVDCAISSNASFIVSNDRHFDVLRKIKFPIVDVVNIRAFCDMLK